MDSTAFPTKPTDVAALTTVEFTFDVDGNDGPSLDVVCARFVDDANRALVWLIRFRALREWLARADMAAWQHDGLRTPGDISEVAARFELNDQWEFDPARFCSAVDAVVSERTGTVRS
jgi:hypothetical protein